MSSLNYVFWDWPGKYVFWGLFGIVYGFLLLCLLYNLVKLVMELVRFIAEVVDAAGRYFFDRHEDKS